MTDTEISVRLSSTFWDGPPKAKILIDGKIMYDKEIIQDQTFSWVNSLDEGEHTLEIQLYGKDKHQTVLEYGKIVKDQLLNIEDVMFNQISIGMLKHSLSKYYPDRIEDVTKQPPEVLYNCVNLGYNGSWKLTFTAPIYLWLLENI